MNEYDIVIIGAGPAGMMATISAAQSNLRILLLEKNLKAGRKLLLTGNGRCNLTNSLPVDEFIKGYGKTGKFLYSAFHNFFRDDLISFLKQYGTPCKTEDTGLIYPKSDRASDVLSALMKAIHSYPNTHILTSTPVSKISHTKEAFNIYSPQLNHHIKSSKLIIATGGLSYPETGSSGEGFLWCKNLGHSVTPLIPSLVPFICKDSWIKQLRGITLEHAQFSWHTPSTTHYSPEGMLLFTHFGLSGPLVLNASLELSSMVKREPLSINLDCMAHTDTFELSSLLNSAIKTKPNQSIGKVLSPLLPNRFIEVVLQIVDIDPAKRMNQITRSDKQVIITSLKKLPLTITGTLPIEKAYVTKGGVSLHEINSHTLESKIVKGLYFAGEIIDCSGISGGYNLQQAFSTGYLAGYYASKNI